MRNPDFHKMSAKTDLWDNDGSHTPKKKRWKQKGGARKDNERELLRQLDDGRLDEIITEVSEIFGYEQSV